MTDTIRTWKPEPKRNGTPNGTPKKPKVKPMSDLLWDTCIAGKKPIRVTFTDGESIEAVLLSYDTYHFKLRTDDKRTRVAFKQAVRTIEWGND